MKQISIIIPTLNEETCIGKLLNQLKVKAHNFQAIQIIVADAGSSDNTQNIVKSFTNAKLINSERGRAKQMNAGSKEAEASILYFLHADTIPPKNFDDYIIKAVKNGHETGCFRLRFDHNHWWLWLASFLTRLPWKICRGGDQSLFISKSLFEQIGGFDEQFSIFEDMDMIRKLYKASKFKIIQKQVLTSSRRYRLNGIATLQYHFYILYLKRFFGADPKELERYYIKNIQ
ncbi:TIGR04283 family arsenosugar biosynthesis glycosyltransferase [Aegicerativicinus sediminis]|uniref:TIGR04283 family arsenosugar biosynthesis glycosyltransferase n=1 Tax=Aegicerativicinus sediminis TaxID=2893202 RepID=UPI001E455E14|nr:TIGR04283 family arsenosugar biosynthesis glycosyltransferase [Aegicerativicinus sediminis]